MRSPDKRKKLIAIAGPTAVGKTSLAIQLAKYLDCEVISADSRQIYKEMRIGTAKPSSEEMEEVPHHFIDHISVKNDYSAGIFEREAIERIKSLFSHSDYIIMAGGTGLYHKAVLFGLDSFPEVESNILSALEDELKNFGLHTLTEELVDLDPIYAASADINNSRRVIRALSVIRQSKKPYSSFLNKRPKSRDFDVIPFLLVRNKKILHERIDLRTDRMLERGLIQEVQKLIPYRSLRSLQTVGYREVFQYLDGLKDMEETARLIKTKTRQYAKRQLTYFRNQFSWKEFHPEAIEEIINYIKTKKNINIPSCKKQI